MPFVNLTPHLIVLQKPDGSQLSIPSTGVARIDSKQGEKNFEFFGIPMHHATEYGLPEGLPEANPFAPDSVGDQEPTIYIVSALFAGRVGDRKDVFYPGTGPKDGAIRDEKGMVKAVTRLIQA